MQATLQHTPEDVTAATRGHYALETPHDIVCYILQGSADFTLDGSTGGERGEEL